MKLSEPKVITFLIAVALGVLGLLAALVEIPVLSPIAIWLIVLGFFILVLGNLVKGI
jgi:hypothetical protein